MLDPQSILVNAQSNLVLDPWRIPVQGPTASPCSPRLAGATGAGRGQSLCPGRPLCRASSHLLPSPFLQTSMSAPLTGPATTSASTPPAASSASATRATRSTGSPTAEVGPAGCWQPVTPPGSGPKEGHGVGRPRGAAAVGALGTLPTPRAHGEGRFPAYPGLRPGWEGAHSQTRWCLQLQTERQEQFATCLQRERRRNPRRFWQGAVTGWEGEHQKGLI